MKMGALILAAGAASRMQLPKMLLPFNGKTILGHILDEIKAIEPEAICLVTGRYHQEIVAANLTNNSHIFYHANWQAGMAGSIVAGIQHLIQKNCPIEAVLIVVSDQPFINRTLLANMKQEKIQGSKGIVAAEYGGIAGTPAIFDVQFFTELQKLTGDMGAKSILHKYPATVSTIPFPLGAIDIDTPEDYRNLLK